MGWIFCSQLESDVGIDAQVKIFEHGKPAGQLIALQKCIDSGSNSTNLIRSASVRTIRFSEAIMNWNKPKVKEICIGMEINDYFPAEF
jgi:coenzyme PQQ precursor peptide PqqA